jgi:serine/threonine-protein kinase
LSIEFLKTNYEKIDYLNNLLKSRATGKEVSDNEYKVLRTELLSNSAIESYLPIWLKTNGDLNSFWRFIKGKFQKYDERTKFLSDEFEPLINYLAPKELKQILIPKDSLPLSKDILKKELNDYLKIKDKITNIYGDFLLSTKVLGNGGTSVVKGFNFHGKEYAIKFLLENIEEKENTTFKRFKQAHLNLLSIQHLGVILPQIHFDSIEIKQIKIPYIIMPKAENTLKVYIEDKKKNDAFNFTLFKKLFDNLINIVDIIHNQKIIHRDIKPENIFILDGRLVLGDFDIAKFNDDEHIKLIDTKKGDRLANFYYSAPEQSSKKFDEITFAADWYAIGQVLYWLITGDTLRGQDNITFAKYDKNYKEFEILIKTLLSNSPKDRFSSKQDIENFLQSKKKISWEDTLHNFDEIIYKYMPEFGMRQGMKTYTDSKTINEIMNDLSSNVKKLNLWWSQGYSDMNIYEVVKAKYCDTCWIVGLDEIKIKSIWFYKHHESFGGSCIIIETDSFSLTGLYPEATDYEEFGIFNDHYITRTEFDSGWAVLNGERIKLNGEAILRGRILTDTIFFLAPQSGPLITNDKIIDKIYKDYQVHHEISEKSLEPLKEIRRSHDILMMS